MTRRTFLKRSSVFGTVALAALAGTTACEPSQKAARAYDERSFLAPTRVPSPHPPPGPDPTSVARSAVVARATPIQSVPVPDPVAVATAPAPTPAAPRQPNVLLVTIDTLRSDRLGSYGYAQAHTPILDQLAREGVRFDYAICQLPQTDPSHAALLTGRYASTNGVKVHMVDKLRAGSQTIASVFEAAGYQTAGIYSWVSLDPQFCGLNQGFQTYDGYVLNRGAIFSDPRLEQLAATFRQIKAAVPIVRTADVAFGGSQDIEASLDGRADITNAAVFKWLDDHATVGPFFLWVHYYDPHYPYSPPTGYDHILGLDYHGSIDGSVDTIHKIEDHTLSPSAADIARMEELYQGEIAFTDAQFGKLLDYLTKLGVADDTIIAVTGDHGESFGEHDDWTHGLKVYETEIRVPLFMRYQRRLPPGTAVTAPAQLIDIMPTLLDLAGLQAKQAVQGTSLLPLIAGQTNGAERAAFTELA
ncbi:MAG TPA: sulfatase, partial [Chloroflexota bacterium]|nr:sulfatase [Chloroflexota bacterium]